MLISRIVHIKSRIIEIKFGMLFNMLRLQYVYLTDEILMCIQIFVDVPVRILHKYCTKYKNQPYLFYLSILGIGYLPPRACVYIYISLGIDITNVADKVLLQAPITPFQWILDIIFKRENIKTSRKHYRNILMKLSGLYRGKKGKNNK